MAGPAKVTQMCGDTAMAIPDTERQSRRLQLVDEHVSLENRHD